MDALTATPAVQDDVRQVVLKALDATDEPITAARLREQLLGQYRRRPEAEISEILENAVAAGKAYRFSPYRGKKPRYWTRTLDAFAQRLIVQAIAREPLLWTNIKSKLKTQLRDLPAERQEQALHDLVAAHRVFEIPGLKTREKSRFGSTPADPLVYLQPAIEGVVEKLARVGVSREEVLAALRRWGAEPISGEEVIVHGAADFPGAGEGALVSIPKLREAVGERLSKPEFDRAVLRLYEQGRIHLHQTDHPGGLSESQREQLIKDASGRYFVGLVLK